tara:strand:- start:64 stop:246 length:183 start_codon:yes stop_codon:yes gene_type:complete
MEPAETMEDLSEPMVAHKINCLVAITLDTYSHVLPGMQEDAALSLDAVFKVAMSKHKENK